jgi:predicted TIM-barrel fold metal-dependent hydrolase
MVKRIIDSHAHIGDIFHENKNITFKTGIRKGDYEDPFVDCERSGYSIPLIPKNIESLIIAGQNRCWEWTLENLVGELDEHPEVEGIVMLPIWPNQTFEEYLAASMLEPRIIPFTTCVLDMPLDDMCAKLQQDIECGAKGLKLHPTIQNLALDDPRTEAAVKVFSDANLPVVTHCGANPYYTEDSPWSKKTNPMLSDFPAVIEFCRRNSEAKIIVAHCCTIAEQLFEAVQGLDNVYTDTTTCSHLMMRKGVELLGEDKIVFGTDVPFGSFHFSIVELEKAFPDDPAILDKVAYSNIANLMQMDFKPWSSEDGKAALS